jgi:hypothetical protein
VPIKVVQSYDTEKDGLKKINLNSPGNFPSHREGEKNYLVEKSISIG